MKRLLVAMTAIAALGGCGRADEPAAPAVAEAALDGFEARVQIAPLPELFDCLRESGGVLVAAHRGGFAPGFPENALETLQHGLSQGIRVFEIDVATSRDGVLFLYHDDRFGRTAAGEGYVSDTDWADIARLRLKDSEGELTGFHPTKLTDALLWAKAHGAILELDRKQTTGFRNIIEAVSAAGAAHNVIMISYSDEEAAAIAKLDPALMMTASARGGRDIAKLEALGVDRTRIIGWTGTREPDPAAFERLVAEGVEPAFGTLGRKGERLDDQYWEDGDGSEYQRLVDDGVVLIATDEPYRVADYLLADDEGWETCARR
ncbi:MAG: glycerophosphodiester phosphodiesterase family protein [Hyphomonas sp.]